MSISPDLTGGSIIKVWGQIVLLGTTTIKDAERALLSAASQLVGNVGDTTATAGDLILCIIPK